MLASGNSSLFAMCCAVLCCAVLCCAVLCCADYAGTCCHCTDMNKHDTVELVIIPDEDEAKDVKEHQCIQL